MTDSESVDSDSEASFVSPDEESTGAKIRLFRADLVAILGVLTSILSTLTLSITKAFLLLVSGADDSTVFLN